MNSAITLSPRQLSEFLLHTAVVRPVFIWGQPGIGKSALVRGFAEEVGLPCVSLLGSQLAPEDLMGVPQIVDGKSVFCPPRMIAREQPYVLFLDELNACNSDVQKAFYSLILDHRVGEYQLPTGSVVIAAGNRTQDSAIVKPVSSALINRMVHVHLRASFPDWLTWAHENELHSLVIEYLTLRPDHLWQSPPKHEEPFSTPRAWHMVSDVLKQFGSDISPEMLSVVALGCLSPHHATNFKGFAKQVRNRFALDAILSGDEGWPTKPEDRDVLSFLAQSFRNRMIKELPMDKEGLTSAQRNFAHKCKALLKALANLSLEIAQMVVGEDEQKRTLPAWFLLEVVRDLPRLVKADG